MRMKLYRKSSRKYEVEEEGYSSEPDSRYIDDQFIKEENLEVPTIEVIVLENKKSRSKEIHQGIEGLLIA